jgi:thiol-disulfide isomerase/thioredoxin
MRQWEHFMTANELSRRPWPSPSWLIVLAVLHGCAATAPASQHGAMSSGSQAKHADWEACEHGVPREVCTRCHPELVASFKAAGDWCEEHGVPESQCLQCNPDLDFSPPREAPKGADVATIAHGGEDVAALEPFCVPQKMTVFDFYASWCPPCRKVDEQLYAKLPEGGFAIRKLDIGTWQSPLAKHWLGAVPDLPFVVVYSRDCKRVAEVSGADRAAIDRALEEGRR